MHLPDSFLMPDIVAFGAHGAGAADPRQTDVAVQARASHGAVIIVNTVYDFRNEPRRADKKR
jgi:hypothetical protein